MTSNKSPNRGDCNLARLSQDLAKGVEDIHQIVLRIDERVSDIADEVLAIRDTLATYELGSAYVPDSNFDFYQEDDD